MSARFWALTYAVILLAAWFGALVAAEAIAPTCIGRSPAVASWCP